MMYFKQFTTIVLLSVALTIVAGSLAQAYTAHVEYDFDGVTLDTGRVHHDPNVILIICAKPDAAVRLLKPPPSLFPGYGFTDRLYFLSNLLNGSALAFTPDADAPDTESDHIAGQTRLFQDWPLGTQAFTDDLKALVDAGYDEVLINERYRLSEFDFDEQSGVFSYFLKDLSVPEPTTMALFAIGLLGLLGFKKRQKSCVSKNTSGRSPSSFLLTYHSCSKGLTKIFLILVCALVMTGLSPTLSSAQIVRDAYLYQDEFGDYSGLDESSVPFVSHLPGGDGIEITDNQMISTKCITLPQPSSGTFQNWSFLEINLSDLGAGNSLEISNCSGTTTLKTVSDLSDGINSVDLSDILNPSIQVKLNPGQAGAKLYALTVAGQSAGITKIKVIPGTLTPKSGDTITFTINLVSSGAVTRNPVLRFSLDDINGLHTPDSDDGLAEDAEVDYGNGVKTYKPLEFVSASNGPNGEVPVTPSAGAKTGEIVWNLDDLSEGFSGNVTVTLGIPKGYIDEKTLQTKAVLEHGSSSGVFTNQMTAEHISELVTVDSVHVNAQDGWSPYSIIGSGVTNIYDSYFIRSKQPTISNPSEAEDITLKITGVGTCEPLFKELTVDNPYAYQIISQPDINTPITEDSPILVHLDRVQFHSVDRTRINVFYDVPDDCLDENSVGTRSVLVAAKPAWNEADSNSHDIKGGVPITCRTGESYTFRVMRGNLVGSYSPWPGWGDFYIRNGSSLKTGEYFITWAPYGNSEHRTQTETLEHSYALIDIPAGITFHGVRGQSDPDWLSRVYKDCSGLAPTPSDPTFDHDNLLTPHPLWKPVDINWNGSPFTDFPDENNPRAVVPSACRLLSVKDDDNPAWQGPDYGYWNPYFLWRVADGNYGVPEVPDGSQMSLVGGTIFTHTAGETKQCAAYDGWTLYKEAKSWPKAYASSEEAQLFAGNTAHIRIIPENENNASQYVDGRWGINLYQVRDYVDVQHISGDVLTDGLNIPKPGQNEAGESCDPTDILFHAPDSAACLSASDADDPACLAWWEVPAACQPPNGWGNRMSTDRYHNDYIGMYNFRLNVPILSKTPAGTELNFVAEVRTNDLSQRGADNAVDPARWSSDNYTANASVTVLNASGLGVKMNADDSRLLGQNMLYHLELKNYGNTPNNGWYLVDLLPKAVVNYSEVTPEYGKVYIKQAAETVLLETTTDASCFSDPFGVSWTAVAVQNSSYLEYLAETVNALDANTTCFRLRHHPASSQDFNPGDLLEAAVEVSVPDNETLAGKVFYSRALAGATTSFGAPADTDPVETMNVQTLVQNASMFCDSVTEIPKTECEALVALYNSTDGDNWTDNTDWLQTNTPCSWFGVTCESGHVTELGLPSNQLNGNIPKEIGNLVNLQRLNLYQNELSGEIPPELGNLVNLVELTLYRNQLIGWIPVTLGQLTKLQHLSLSWNQLRGPVPSEFGNFTDIQYLHVRSNPLQGSLPQNLQNLTTIQSFIFNETGLCEPQDAALQSWLAGIPTVQGTGSACGVYDYFLYEEYGGTWHDLDKSGGDENLCWAFAVANILKWAGWEIAGEQSAAEMIAQIKGNWTNKGGLMKYPLRWWLSGAEPPNFGDLWSQLTAPGSGGFHENKNFFEKYGFDYRRNMVEAVTGLLRSGSGVGIALYDRDNSLDPVGHVLTVWGYRYLADGTVIGLWVTDSDDGKTEEWLLPVSYQSQQLDGDLYDLKWRVADDSPRYAGWLIEGAQSFEQREPRYLRVRLAGTGRGAVSSAPDGIACGEHCVGLFAENTPVSLTATPMNGSTFAGWAGACAGSGECVVTVDDAKEVFALFEAQRAPGDETVTMDVSASAGVTIYPANGVVPEGADATYLFVPEPGTIIENVLIDGQPVGAVSSYTFPDASTPHSIEVKTIDAEARFAILRKKCVATDDDGNIIYEHGAMKEIACEPGQNATITAGDYVCDSECMRFIFPFTEGSMSALKVDPDPGMEVKTWELNGSAYTPEEMERSIYTMEDLFLQVVLGPGIGHRDDWRD